ncbi:MAG: hypothetical protein RIR70_1611, partial [Pseudomonadota bacterium]
TEQGSELALRALSLGAVDVIGKPTLSVEQGMRDYAELICEKLRAAAGARVRRLSAIEKPIPLIDAPRTAPFLTTEKIIAVGASTGGTEAIQEFLLGLPPTCPGIVITQHMPERFTRSFAERLDRTTALTVCEAADNQRILQGHVYIAPGHSHLLLKRSGAHYLTSLSDGELVNRHRPSVDVLFQSVARHAGPNAIGIILTGMGKDGAAGLLAMRQAGAATFAQDEETCVVFGMPREAALIGAAEEVAPIHRLAAKVLERLGK